MNDTEDKLGQGLDQAYEGALAGAQFLYERAFAAAEAFWEAHHRNHKLRPKHEWGFIGVRVRLRNGSVQIEWFRAKYWQPRYRSGNHTRRQPALQYLPRGKSMRYSAAAFRRVRAKEWEIDLAMLFENEFEAIRRQSQMLGKVRRYIIETRKAAAAERALPASDDALSPICD
ncbi:hypothetical protein J7355_16005 [Endozoicomonas sp. G2_2]|uniref:conjugative transfer protein MobI(A/C) n=1 Tax=Gammaproteobacteria TaxID=1236 RepID=UPI001AD9E458|nr:hypothetical protein [Endozoicomonas sp. G2_2]